MPLKRSTSIKSLFISLSLLVANSALCAEALEYHDFVIVIPSYNNQRWCQANVLSALNQNYPPQHFRIIFVNDCSTDATSLLVRYSVKSHANRNLITLIDNPARRGALQNFYEVITNLCRPEEIIVTLDGDDLLKGTTVLSYLNQIYADPEVWLTYGSYEFWQWRPHFIAGAAPYPPAVVATSTFRQHGFLATHLRTFYAGLFHKIKLTDLQDADGRFWQVCPDLAIMFPLLEMAGEHLRFITKILYRYNVANWLAENSARLTQIRQFNQEFSRKSPYQRLTMRDW